MKKFVLINLLALILLFTFAGCRHMGHLGVQGSGVRKTEARALTAFKAIELDGAYAVQVTCQKNPGLQIEADDNVLPLILTDVRDGVLYVRSEKSYSTHDVVSLKITTANLEKITSHGAGKIDVADLKNDKFEVDSTGASTFNVAGVTKSVEIHSSGAGKIDAGNLHAEKAAVNISGVASVDVYASEQLEATVSGVGHVSYSGDPKNVSQHVSGPGGIAKKE